MARGRIKGRPRAPKRKTTTRSRALCATVGYTKIHLNVFPPVDEDGGLLCPVTPNPSKGQLAAITVLQPNHAGWLG